VTERKPPAFSFYANDFLVGTVTLSLAARGAYITLLAYEWDHGSVPDDPSARARVLGCARRESETLWTRLREKFFQGDDGAWRNARLEGERLKQVERRITLARNGALGGRPKNQKDKPRKTKRFAVAKPDGQPDENLNKSLPSSSSSSSSEKRVGKDHQHAVRSADADAVSGTALHAFLARFCELYAKYRHGAKYLVRREKDIPLARRLLQVYPAERLEKLTIILLTTDHEWITTTDRGLGILSTKASWLDGLLAEHEAHKRSAAS